MAGGWFVHASAHSHNEGLISYVDGIVTQDANTEAGAMTVSKTTSDTSLVSDMNTAIDQYSSLDAAATVIDLNTGKEYDAGTTATTYEAASTTKVLAAVAFLHEVEQGDASLDDTIDGMTAELAMQQMIEVSDNDAWAGFNDFLGDYQQTYADDIGLSSYDASDNTITAADEAKLLEQLADGKLLDSAGKALLYEYMENTDSTDLIPAALPTSATVYHKYGQVDGVLHDAAIVDYDGHQFVLVVYTNNPDGTSDDYDDQVALIHAVTTAAVSDIDK
jgi:beta-lactamase class A